VPLYALPHGVLRQEDAIILKTMTLQLILDQSYPYSYPTLICFLGLNVTRVMDQCVRSHYVMDQYATQGVCLLNLLLGVDRESLNLHEMRHQLVLADRLGFLFQLRRKTRLRSSLGDHLS